MTRKHTSTRKGFRAMALVGAVGTTLMLAAPTMAAPAKNPVKRAQATKQPAGVKSQAAPGRTQTARGQQNGRPEARDNAQRRNHDRNTASRGRDRHEQSKASGGRRDHHAPNHNRGHDRKGWDRKYRGTDVVVVVNQYHPAPRTNLLGTISINGVRVDVRKDHVFDAFREAARCAGYTFEKVKVNGRSYLRIYGCPSITFSGIGYELDVIRYYNDVIDIALFREVC